MKIKKQLVVALSLIILSYSYSKDDHNAKSAPKGVDDNGILISHEGPFSGGFGTVSYGSNDFFNVQNTVFSNLNVRALGTVVQSMVFNGDLVYSVINESNNMNEISTTIPTTPEFLNVSFYDMKVRDGFFYGLDAGNFSSKGLF